MNRIELDANLLALLPPWYRAILDYQEICQTEEAQLEALGTEISSVAENFFFQTMDESAVAQWEQVFQIAADPAVETLAFRRARLLNRISTHPPFTLGFLYHKLDELIGPGRWSVRVDYPNYTLYIESSAVNQSYAQEVAFTINRIKPAHIVYRNAPYLTAALELSETILQKKLRYNYRLGLWALGMLPFAQADYKIEGNYRLGSWGLGTLPFAALETMHYAPNYHLGTWPLGAEPFADIGLEEVIKLPVDTSIQYPFLEDVATYAASDIVSARINGLIVISDLTKSADGAELTVSYTVTPQQVEEINKLELLDSGGEVLTSAVVYVPVTGNTVLSHTIIVREGVKNNA